MRINKVEYFISAYILSIAIAISEESITTGVAILGAYLIISSFFKDE